MATAAVVTLTGEPNAGVPKIGVEGCVPNNESPTEAVVVVAVTAVVAEVDIAGAAAGEPN